MEHQRRRQYRRQQSLDSVDEEDFFDDDEDEEDEEAILQRKLIDYTVSNGRRRRVDCQEATSLRRLPLGRANSMDRQTEKLILPSFNYLEKIPYSSFLQEGHNTPSSEEGERIDFFLKVKKKKKRASGTKIHDFRAGLEKSRSQKSLLFGSFLAENGARRSSYVDLKKAWSNGKGMCALTF